MWRPARALSSSSYWESGVAVYPISPTRAKAYRQRKVPSGNKTDHVDAWSLADALRVDGHGWKALAKEDPLVAELRLLCRDEVALIEERTASSISSRAPCANITQRLWRPLKTGHCRARGPSWKPSPPRRLWYRLANWEKFLHTQHLARPQTYQKRMEIFARAAEFVSGQALARAKSRLAFARVRMLRVLQSQIDSYRAEIEKLFAEHPDHDLFGSLPGAGPKIARDCWARSARTARALKIPLP